MATGEIVTSTQPEVGLLGKVACASWVPLLDQSVPTLVPVSPGAL